MGALARVGKAHKLGTCRVHKTDQVIQVQYLRSLKENVQGE